MARLDQSFRTFSCLWRLAWLIAVIGAVSTAATLKLHAAELGGEEMDRSQVATAPAAGLGPEGRGLTLAQLLRKLEKNFPLHLPNEGRLVSDERQRSDLLQSTFEDTYLETLGPPHSIVGLRYNFLAGSKSESAKKRAWAGIVIRNALPAWRGGKAWVRRAFFKLESDPGGEPFKQERQAHNISVAYEPGADVSGRRMVLLVRPLVAQKPAAPSLGISMAQLLAGLGDAFPERLEQRGELFMGPDVPYDQFFSENNFASLSTAGAEDNLMQVQYGYQLRDDRKAEWERNRAYALELIGNALPGWDGAVDWLRDAIAESERDRGEARKRVVRDAIAVEVLYYNGNIGISILPDRDQL